MDKAYLVFEGNPTGPAKHGLAKLEEKLNGLKPGKKIRLGVYTESDTVRALADSSALGLEKKAESFAFANTDNESLLLGYDSKGLMYGCFELIERLEKEADPGKIENFSDAPYTKVRGIYDFLHNRYLEKEWFYSKEFWVEYFDMLAYNRYNSYNLVFSHQTYYMVPMYAYFLNVEEHPEVFPEDITREEHRKNNEMLKFISEEADSRGIDFIIGIWEVRPWKGGENDWRPAQKNYVKGLTDANLESYTYLALKKLFKEFPHVKGLQIRANEESGIPKEKQTDFYTKTFFKAINESERPIIFDFRCWRAEEQTVENALEMCPDIRLSAKYWAEFMGPPYQPGKTEPGYSYANFLKQPLRCDFVYQVWSLGSPRLLLWGDPEYARRFAETLKLGGGSGFEINPHLAQKGYGDEPGYWRIFKNKDDEYYDFEYKRYWMFYELFGRLTYNPNIPDDRWKSELQKRLSIDNVLAGNMLDAYTSASRVLTFMIQYSLNDPNMYVWPEIDLGGILDLYLETPTSDECVIYPIREYVTDYLKSELGGRLSPQDASRYYSELADEIFRKIQPLEKEYEKNGGKELKASLVDFKTLGFLAMYHARKIMAALKLEMFYQTRDIAALRECYDWVHQCTYCWEQLIFVTQSFYSDMMVTGPSDAGCWKTKLTFLYEEELRIAEQLKMFERYGNFHKAFDFGHEHEIEFRDFYRFPLLTQYSTEKGFTYMAPDKKFDGTDFGFTDPSVIKYVEAPDVRLSDKHIELYRRDAYYHFENNLMGYRNMVNVDYVYSDKPAEFTAVVENGKYEVTAVMCDRSSKARIHGPMSIEIGGRKFSDIVAGPLENVEKKAYVDVINGKITLKFDCDPGCDWFISAVVIRKREPAVKLQPVFRYQPNGKTVISATVTCPSPVLNVGLRLISDTGKSALIPMFPKDKQVYEVDISDLVSGNTCSYTYHVLAKSEDGFIGASEKVTMKPSAEDGEIEILHEPVRECGKDKNIELAFKVTAKGGISRARLFYSYCNHYEKLHSTEMVFENGVYKAMIPKEYINPDWQIMYYAEFVDENMKGVVYPEFRQETPYCVIKVNQG